MISKGYFGFQCRSTTRVVGPGKRLGVVIRMGAKRHRKLGNNDRDAGCRQLHRNIISNDKATFFNRNTADEGDNTEKTCFWLIGVM